MSAPLSLVSVRQALHRLARNPRTVGKAALNREYVQATAEVLGIALSPAGTALVMTEPDFERLKAHLIATGKIGADADATANAVA